MVLSCRVMSHQSLFKTPLVAMYVFRMFHVGDVGPPLKLTSCKSKGSVKCGPFVEDQVLLDPFRRTETQIFSDKSSTYMLQPHGFPHESWKTGALEIHGISR